MGNFPPACDCSATYPYIHTYTSP